MRNVLLGKKGEGTVFLKMSKKGHGTVPDKKMLKRHDSKAIPDPRLDPLLEGGKCHEGY